MAEPTQFTFELKEVATALVKQQGLHEGLWMVSFEVGLVAGIIGQSPPGQCGAAEHRLLCPRSAASKYSCSSSSSSFANSSHRLAMSSSRHLLSSFMVFESCKQAAALFLYSCAAVTIWTPLLNGACR
jgi:hypothetical protein